MMRAGPPRVRFNYPGYALKIAPTRGSGGRRRSDFRIAIVPGLPQPLPGMNLLMVSMGTGNTIVEFFSPAISASVCR